MSTKQISGLDPRSNRPFRLTIEGGSISRIEESSEETDLFLCAGLIDLQVNGYGGFDLNAEQISVDAVLGLVNAMLTHGVTCFAPTLISAPEDRICRALKVINEARQSHPMAAECIPFVHIEGPHLSPLDGYRGAHPANAIRPPSLAEFERWQRAGNGLVGMVTLSPHFDNSSSYIAALVERGIRVSIGHTHASPEQITVAVDAGASMSTHLGNGIALEVPRHRNPIWRQLADSRLSATFIADGHHLPSDVFQVMVKAKGVARSVLVSDSVALAGMPAGTYSSPVGGRVEIRPDGRLCVCGSEILAGSTASLPQCIGWAVRACGIPLQDALSMATENPGRLVGGRGQLTIGSRANLLRFRWRDDVVIEDVWVAGEQVRGTLN